MDLSTEINRMITSSVPNKGQNKIAYQFDH